MYSENVRQRSIAQLTGEHNQYILHFDVRKENFYTVCSIMLLYCIWTTVLQLLFCFHLAVSANLQRLRPSHNLTTRHILHEFYNCTARSQSEIVNSAAAKSAATVRTWFQNVQSVRNLAHSVVPSAWSVSLSDRLILLPDIFYLLYGNFLHIHPLQDKKPKLDLYSPYRARYIE